MIILGVETSCDETGVAVYNGQTGKLVHRLYSQVALHAQFGGVVPELASRDHVRKLLPLVREVLQTAGVQVTELAGIAYTAGPGLVGALLVGAAFAHALAMALQCPVIPVHHLEGHLLAAMLVDDPPTFPFLALLVSGGHTQLIEARGLGDYQMLGETLDDAVGEAFDKVAKVLGIPYPGGPKLAQLALTGQAGRFTFPRPMAQHRSLDFSFSGLKTFAANCWREHADDEKARADIAWAFQEAATEALLMKCRQALKAKDFCRLVVAGGVSANRCLRHKLDKLAESSGKFQVYYPPLEFCTDNGAMIAYTGWRRFAELQQDAGAIKVFPRWKM